MIERFLAKEAADVLYLQMMSLPWTGPEEQHGFELHFGKSYGRAAGGCKGEIPQIPEFLATFARQIEATTKTPVNYVQCHKYGVDQPVRPHHDPAGMVVPMLVVGQERTFRVGGESITPFQAQDKHPVENHQPAEELLMRHGSLLVFNGGRVWHSMFPATQDKRFNPNGYQWRFSILFRWTTDVLRDYGIADKSHASQRKTAYRRNVALWRKDHGQGVLPCSTTHQ
jgi:hypothetical protein